MYICFLTKRTFGFEPATHNNTCRADQDIIIIIIIITIIIIIIMCLHVYGPTCG